MNTVRPIILPVKFILESIVIFSTFIVLFIVVVARARTGHGCQSLSFGTKLSCFPPHLLSAALV